MNQLYIALPFLQFAVSLFLAGVVVMSDHRARQNRYFVLFLLAMALWGITVFAMRDAFPDRRLAYMWEKGILAVVPFSSIFFFHFVVSYTRTPRKRRILATMYAAGLCSAALSLAGQSATGMEEKFYGFAPQLGWAFPLVLGAAYPPVLLALRELTRALATAKPARERARLQALRVGLAVSVLGATFDFLPSLGLSVYPMGVFGNLLFALITTWAVTRYRLMNLRLALRHGLAYSFISSVIFAAYAGSYGAVLLFTRNLSLAASVITAAGTVLLVGVFLQPVLGRVQAFVDRAFFRERIDRLAALGRLNEITKDIADFSALASSLVAVVRRSTQADWVALMLPGRTGQHLSTMADSRRESSGLALPCRGQIASWLAEHGSVLRAEDIRTEPSLREIGDEERRAVDESGVALMIPLIVNRSLTGVLGVGPRLVGSDFSREDVSFLHAAADQAAIAVENARLYATARREAKERTALAELGRVVSSTLDMDSVFERCAEQARLLLPCDRFVITTIDHEEGSLTDAFVTGVEIPGEVTGRVRLIENSSLRDVIQRRDGIICGGDPAASRGAGLRPPEAALAAGLPSMLAVPLMSNDRVIGAMNLSSRRPNAYTVEELGLAEQVGAQIANAIANSQLFEQTLQLADEREQRARLDAENQELQRVSEARSRFLSTVSHELKTPLTSINAFTDILIRNRNRNLAERQLQHLGIMQRNGRRLKTMIDDLLDVSRIDGGSLKTEPTEFDVRSLLDEIGETFAPILGSKSQRLEIGLPDRELWVKADRDRIAQVISNFLSNASKYSPDGSLIEVAADGQEDRLHVQVRDHGIGISADDQKKLFSAFFRAENDATRAVPGTGLGMVIARGIVELHGGEVSVASESGEGTTVAFYIKGLIPAPSGVEAGA